MLFHLRPQQKCQTATPFHGTPVNVIPFTPTTKESECHTVSRYTSKCYSIYAHNSTAFPKPIFTKLPNAQQHYVQICYTVLHNKCGKRGYRCNIDTKTVRLSPRRFSWTRTHSGVTIPNCAHIDHRIWKVRGRCSVTPWTEVWSHSADSGLPNNFCK